MSADEERWERYTLGRRIDGGGKVAWFHATRSGTSEEVVVLRVPLAVTDWPPWADPAIAKILVHPNIVRLFDCERGERSYWFALERVDGGDLRAFLRRAPLSFDDGLFIAREVCRALVHGLGATAPSGSPFAFTHGSLSPREVRISTRGEVKLAGFAIGDLDLTPVRVDGPVRDRWRYLAPEALRRDDGGGGDPRVDVYAVGAMMYEMWTGRRWNDASTLLEIMKRTDEMREAELRLALAPSDPRARVLAGALAGDPASRYRDAGELLRALGALKD